MTVKWNSLQSIFLFLLGRSYQEKSIDQVYVKLSTFTVFYFQNLFLFFFTHLSWWEPLKYYVHIVKIPVRKFYEMLGMVYIKGLDFFFQQAERCSLRYWLVHYLYRHIPEGIHKRKKTETRHIIVSQTFWGKGMLSQRELKRNLRGL